MAGRASLYRPLLLAALILAFCVVGLGAYVRLSDAGLGCPDWPGCYGHLVGVPEAAHERAAAAAVFPGKPVEPAKAWKEMAHRYLAGSLGLLILALCVAAWRRGRERRPWLETALVGLVGFQAALGMWTVTLLLKPAIVTAHLLGGMATWAILVTLALREFAPVACTKAPVAHRRWAALAVLVVFAQIALGGWVSSNYAALACPDLPMCQGEWLPPADFAHAFTLTRELGETASGALLPASALTAIHLVHRAGTALVVVVVGGLAWWLWHGEGRRPGGLLAGALCIQVALGVGNVLLQLPLPLAVAHNLGAAILLASCLLVHRHLAGGFVRR